MEPSEKGASTVEYVILISLCSLICISAVAELGIEARRKFYVASEAMRQPMDTSGLTEEGEG